MFAALAKSFAQLGDPAFRRVLALSLGASAALFVVLWALAWLGLGWLAEDLAAWIATQGSDGFWVDLAEWIFGAISVLAVLVTSLMLFPAVVGAVMSLLLDEVAGAVERRHYPDLPPPRAQPLGEALLGALRFAAVTIALNGLALPLYLLLLFVPPLNLFVFYLLNGYLLGREYFELVAARRTDLAGVRQLHRAHRGRVLLAGVVIAFLLTIPLVNLVTPLVATAFMVHVFEGLRRTR